MRTRLMAKFLDELDQADPDARIAWAANHGYLLNSVACPYCGRMIDPAVSHRPNDTWDCPPR